jgi:hypothetical protein
MQIKRLAIAVGLVASVGAVTVWGDTIEFPKPDNVPLSVQWGSSTWVTNVANIGAPGVTEVVHKPGTASTWYMRGAWTGGGGEWTCAWDLEVATDPFVYGTFSFTNNTALDQDYSVNVVLPTVWPGPLQVSGGITGTLLDSDLSGNATIKNSTLGGPIYTALIDGGVEQTLLGNYSFSTASPFPVNWGPPAPANFGPQAGLAPSVTTDIEIDHNFNLSAHDGATLQTIFIVLPEPAGMVLLALGALVAIRRGR